MKQKALLLALLACSLTAHAARTLVVTVADFCSDCAPAGHQVILSPTSAESTPSGPLSGTSDIAGQVVLLNVPAGFFHLVITGVAEGELKIPEADGPWLASTLAQGIKTSVQPVKYLAAGKDIAIQTNGPLLTVSSAKTVPYLVLLDQIVTNSDTISALKFPAENILAISNNISLAYERVGTLLSATFENLRLIDTNATIITVTCAGLTNESFPALTALNGYIQEIDCFALANFEFPKLASINNAGIVVASQIAAPVIAFPVLSQLGGEVVLDTVTPVVFPALANLTGYVATEGTTYFPVLTNLAYTPAIYGFVRAPMLSFIAGVQVYAAIDAQSLPSLTEIGYRGYVSDSGASTHWYFPSLQKFDDGSYGLYESGSTTLLDGSCPVLTTIGVNSFLEMVSSINVTSFSAPLLSHVGAGTTISFNGDSLNVASVNGLLSRLALSGCTGVTINLAGGANAAPSGQGITDAATIVSNGNTLTTN